jgi:alkylation response protein AidB-like acyl-CoA dehydrogenase
MDLELNEDERLLLESLERICAHHGSPPSDDRHAWFHGTALESELEGNGFFAMPYDGEFATHAAGLAVEMVARQAVVVEIATSMLILPQLTRHALPRPIAIVDARDGNARRPTRFLPQARSVLLDFGHEVRRLSPRTGDVEHIDSFLAYPIGRLTDEAVAHTEALAEMRPASLRKWRQVGVALEISGALGGAIEKTLGHVKERRAFGTVIGAFQTVQHRLAHCVQMSHSTRWLALRAAATGDSRDAACALAYANESASLIYHELHQLNGAIGLTFEYPLHYWTLRLKVLQQELGGELELAAEFAELLAADA